MIGLLDFETQSAVDLKHCGGRNYAEDESTRILCLVMLVENTFHCWINGPWKSVFVPRPKVLGDRELITYVATTIPPIFLRPDTLVAHNADEFDRIVWEKKVSREPRTWVDTIHRARSAGLRGSLDELGKRFLGIGKDDVGKRILNKVMTLPNKHTLPGNVGLIASYCVQDVVILERIYNELPDISRCDYSTLHAHRACNSLGVRFDRRLAERIISWGEDEAENAKNEIRNLEPSIVDKLRSPQVMLQWLESEGVHLPDVRKETIERFLNEPDEYSDVEVSSHVSRILELRKSCLRITGAKLKQALASVSSDGRLRDCFVFHGAHTGRWSGRRVQLQNLPRGVPGLNVRGIIEGEVDYRAEAERLETLRLSTPASPVMVSKPITSHDVLSTLIRPCFCGDLLIADYNAVECRGAAWLCDEEKLLEVFRSGGSPYETTATKIFGRKITKKDTVERFIGKETTLGSTYQMSANKFEKYLENKGINLASCGVTGEQCITSFREAYPRLVSTWYDLNNTAMYVVLSGSKEVVAKCTMYMRGSTLNIVLPSGRTLYYNNARVEKCVPVWGGDPINQIVYEGIRSTTNLFGGKLLENITQAVCRDLLACSMVRSKWPIVLHAHDELVGEGRAIEVHEFGKSMAVNPDWCMDFPLGVEYFSCPRYVKEPWETSIRGKV